MMKVESIFIFFLSPFSDQIYYHRAFLDCVNNVAHLGHCHDEVIKVAIKQMSNLNTNTRYLGEEIIRYIKALLGRIYWVFFFLFILKK